MLFLFYGKICLPFTFLQRTEQTPSTQITSESNPNLARAPNKRKRGIQKEKERKQEGQERMIERNGEIGKEKKFKRKKMTSCNVVGMLVIIWWDGCSIQLIKLVHLRGPLLE